MTLKVFAGVPDYLSINTDVPMHQDGIYLDLMQAPKKGEIALVKCDKDGENIVPLLILSEENGEISIKVVR